MDEKLFKAIQKFGIDRNDSREEVYNKLNHQLRGRVDDKTLEAIFKKVDASFVESESVKRRSQHVSSSKMSTESIPFVEPTKAETKSAETNYLESHQHVVENSPLNHGKAVDFNLYLDMAKSAIKHKLTYIPLASIVVALFFVNFVFSSQFQRFIGDILLSGSGVSLSSNDIFEMSDANILNLFSFISPIGLKVTIDDGLFPILFSLRLAIISLTFIFLLLGVLISKYIFKKQNIELSNDKLFVKNTVSISIYTVLFLLYALIVRNNKIDDYFMELSYKVSGFPMLTLLSVIPLGFIISFVVSYSKDKNSEIFSKNVIESVLFGFRKVLIYTVLVVSWFVFISISSNYSIGEMSMLIIYLGHLLYYVVFASLGGSFGLTIPDGESVYYGVFSSTDLGAFFLIVLLVVAFILFFDANLLYKKLKQNNPTRFSAIFASSVVGLLLVFSYSTSIVYSVDAFIGTEVGSFGVNYSTFILVAITAFVGSYGAIMLLGDKDLIHIVKQQINDKFNIR